MHSPSPRGSQGWGSSHSWRRLSAADGPSYPRPQWRRCRFCCIHTNMEGRPGCLQRREKYERSEKRNMPTHNHFSLLQVTTPLTFDHINELVNCGVAAEEDVHVEDLVLLQNGLHYLQIDVRQRDGWVERDSCYGQFSMDIFLACARSEGQK